jgi:hypothetical protein
LNGAALGNGLGGVESLADGFDFEERNDEFFDGGNACAPSDPLNGVKVSNDFFFETTRAIGEESAEVFEELGIDSFELFAFEQVGEVEVINEALEHKKSFGVDGESGALFLDGVQEDESESLTGEDVDARALGNLTSIEPDEGKVESATAQVDVVGLGKDVEVGGRDGGEVDRALGVAYVNEPDNARFDGVEVVSSED